MNKDQLDKLRSVLVQACDAHIANGGRIVSNHFYGTNKGCCPITCVRRLHGYSSDISFIDALSQAIGTEIDDYQFWSFVDGFDDRSSPILNSDPELFDLGKELRNKYIG